MKKLFENPEFTLYIVVCMSSVCSLISTLEWISLKERFKNDNYYSWEISRMKVLAGKPQILKMLIDSIFKYPNVLVILWFQLFSSILIFFTFNHPILTGLSCLGTSIGYFLISYRRVDGYNGGDSMAKVVLLTGAICFLSQSNEILKVGLIFISFQLILAYTTPGLLRLFDSNWRNGKKLMYILRMETFSKKYVYDFFNKRKALIPLTAIAIVIFESFFGLSIFLPFNLLLFVLILGFIFHLTNAIVMGLNTFLWAFVGSYPAFIWTSLYLDEIITGVKIMYK